MTEMATADYQHEENDYLYLGENGEMQTRDITYLLREKLSPELASWRGVANLGLYNSATGKYARVSRYWMLDLGNLDKLIAQGGRHPYEKIAELTYLSTAGSKNYLDIPKANVDGVRLYHITDRKQINRLKKENKPMRRCLVDVEAKYSSNRKRYYGSTPHFNGVVVAYLTQEDYALAAKRIESLLTLPAYPPREGPTPSHFFKTKTERSYPL